MNIKAWKYYYAFFKDHTLKLILSVIVSLAQALANLCILLLVRYAFDEVLVMKDFQLLLLIGVAIAVLYFVNAAAALWVRHTILHITKLAIQQFRDEILKRFYSFPRYYDSAIDRSKLHAIIVQDTERLDIMSNAFAAQLVPTLLICTTVSIVLLYFNWFMFLTIIAFVPFMLVMNRIVGKTVKTRTRAFHRSFENFSKGIKFALENIDLAKIQTAERHEMERQRKNMEELRFSSTRMSWLSYAYIVAQNTIVACSGVAVLIAGGMLVAADRLTLGQFLSFYTAISLLRGYLQTLFACVPQIIEGNESLTTLYNWFEKNDQSPYSGTKRIELKGGIRLDSVSMQFNTRSVLRNIDLTIKPGSTVAIIGPSGAGKSTIVNLILGFYRPHEGQVFIDGYPLHDLDLVNMRRYVRVVRQDPVIFSGTILDNITYGSPDVDFERVIRAAQLATAHEFIEHLPHKYDTHVGEEGMLLSGGQRQRIAITRALLGEPKVLILDEPTNHLDQALINRIMENLSTVSAISVKLIISHNMGVVRQAQKVYMIENGAIVASGAPDEVLKGALI